jgi:hypothetical protein
MRSRGDLSLVAIMQAMAVRTGRCKRGSFWWLSRQGRVKRQLARNLRRISTSRANHALSGMGTFTITAP